MFKGDRTPPAADSVPEGTETGVFDGERARELYFGSGMKGEDIWMGRALGRVASMAGMRLELRASGAEHSVYQAWRKRRLAWLVTNAHHLHGRAHTSRRRANTGEEV